MPEWLPEKTNVNPWTEDTYEMLYEIFCRDIRDYDLRYIGNNVWIKDYDFVVIMKRYPKGHRRLITSFYIDKTYKREDFKRKYASRIK